MKSWSVNATLAILLSLSSLFFANPLLASEIPTMMSHQGYLTDQSGAPINGAVDMRFTLYAGWESLWEENRTVQVSEGNYSINLGEVQPIQLPFDQPYRLGITVNGQEMNQTYPLTSAPYAFGTQPIVRVTEANFDNVPVRDGAILKFEGDFTIDEDYELLRSRELTIFGGSFTGNGDVEIRLGPKTIVSGASFSDVRFHGSDVTFEKCTFTGDIEFPGGNTVLRDCNLGGVTGSGSIALENSEIHSSTLLLVDRLSGCEIEDSTIGDESYNTNITVNSCTIGNSRIYLGYGSGFIGNQCRYTSLGIWDAADGSIVVTGNEFHHAHDKEQEMIFVQANSENFRCYVITSNTFHMGGDSSKHAILVAGAPNNQNQMLKITGNTFVSGLDAIGFLGNFSTLVSDNLTRNILLGVQTADPYLKVINNHHFQ